MSKLCLYYCYCCMVCDGNCHINYWLFLESIFYHDMKQKNKTWRLVHYGGGEKLVKFLLKKKKIT